MLRQIFVEAAIAVAVLATVPVYAGNENPNPGVMPPQSHSFGQTYGNWAQDWWNWAVREPIETSPLLDDTGEFGGLNQDGHVWFLAGTLGGEPVERELTVPAGKALFFPSLTLCIGRQKTSSPVGATRR